MAGYLTEYSLKYTLFSDDNEWVEFALSEEGDVNSPKFVSKGSQPKNALLDHVRAMPDGHSAIYSRYRESG